VFIYQVVHPESLTLSAEGFAFTNLGRTAPFSRSELGEFGVARIRARWQTIQRVGLRTQRSIGPTVLKR